MHDPTYPETSEHDTPEEHEFRMRVRAALESLTPAEFDDLRRWFSDPTGVTLPQDQPPTADELRESDEWAVKAIRRLYPHAPANLDDWDTAPIRPAGDR